jgi:hypothetical protein
MMMSNKRRKINRAWNSHIEPASTVSDRIKNDRIALCQLARQKKRRA